MKRTGRRHWKPRRRARSPSGTPRPAHHRDGGRYRDVRHHLAGSEFEELGRVQRGARPGRAAWLTLLIGVTVAAVDEAHQSLLLSRTGSVRDVFIDTAGVALALALARLGWRRAAEAATGVLLWVGLLGGLAALALALAAGVGGGVLWLTVPVAAGALVYRWRKSAAGRV